MDRSSWLHENKEVLGSQFEECFVERVLGGIPEIDYGCLQAQMPFRDQDGKQRYCDFVIREGSDVRIAIEIDGYDKTGSGQGMTHEQFVDWQRRHASLVAQGWDVIRFANRDVMNTPRRCARLLQTLLHRERERSRQNGRASEMVSSLSEEDREALDQYQKDQARLKSMEKQGGLMKTTIWAFAAITVAVIGLFFYQSVHLSTGNQGRDHAVASDGSSCENPMSWKAAKDHVGEVLALSGPVIRVTTREEVNGSPTWIDVGASYPNSERLVLVIWGDDRDGFEAVRSDGIEGDTVCAIGEVELYNDVSQIVLYEKGQLVM